MIAEALREGIPVGLTLYAPQTYTSKAFTDYEGRQDRPLRLQRRRLRGRHLQHGAGDRTVGQHLLHPARGADRRRQARRRWRRRWAYVQGQALRRRPAPGAGASFVLGSYGVSPLAMAGAYATFAAHGLYCPPRVVTEITGPDRAAIPVPPQSCEQVLEPGVADTVTSILRGVIDGPTHGRTGARASIGRPAAGKTGTVNESKAAWFIGYTPQLAASVWLGMPEPGKFNGRPRR